ARARLGISDGEPVVLVAARLAEEKQPTVMAETFRLLHGDGVRFTALIAGDGPYMGWLRGYTRRHMLRGDVRLLGAVPRDQVVDLLAAADVFFLPSRWEGIALAIYEAMSSSLPVVAADVGGQ